MIGIFPLSGAYGRDYKNDEEVINDWRVGKDFKTAGGQYCSIRDFDPQECIVVRYNSMMKTTVFISITGK